MPEVFRTEGYVFYFYANEGHEPVHIHVKRDRNVAKFWLDPIEIAKNSGFAEHEAKQIERLVAEHREFLMEAWREYFDA